MMSAAARIVGAPVSGEALFEALEAISSLPYEGGEATGRLVLSRADRIEDESGIQLVEQVPLTSARRARKLLETAVADLALRSDGYAITHLARIPRNAGEWPEDTIVISMLGHHLWAVENRGWPVMRVRGGVPEAPSARLTEEEFRNLLHDTFPAEDPDSAQIWKVVKGAIDQRHGTTVVIADRAESEAERLQVSATRVQPSLLDAELAQAVTSIDGAVLIGLDGRCYAIGVIMDGMASERGDPARGSRYNSMLRYVDTALREGYARCLALVISEDGYVDPVVPQPERNG
jgi:hypothetical protein